MVERKEKNMNTGVNKMTQETHTTLQKELVRIKNLFRETGQRMGDAFGQGCDWHDNSAADFVVEEYRRIGVQEAELSKILDSVQIIKPRIETDDVGIGNTVIVRLGDFGEDETFTLLGPQDGVKGGDKGWISYLSPVGSAMLGMKQGEIKEFPVGERKQTVTIKEVLPGDFNNEGKKSS